MSKETNPIRLTKEQWRDWLQLDCTRYYFTMLQSEKDKTLDGVLNITQIGSELSKAFYEGKGTALGLELAISAMKENAKLYELEEEKRRTEN